MKIDKHEFVRTTHTINIPQDKILEMFRAEGIDVDKLAPITVACKSSKSVMVNKFGVLRDPGQTLMLSVTTEEERTGP